MSVKLSYNVYYMRATWCYEGAYTQYNIRGYDQTFYFNHECQLLDWNVGAI